MSVPLRLLILEDRPADADLALFELRRSGFVVHWERVDTEAGYRAALARATHLPPDLILADYNLPQFDALGALEILQATQLDIPFIVVTGAVGEEAVVECMKRGATDYLLKDRLSRLGAAVQHALAEQQLRAAKRAAEAAERDQRIWAEALRDTTAALAHTLNFDDVLERILENVGRVVPHDAVNIMLIEDRGSLCLIPSRARGYAAFGMADLQPILDLHTIPILHRMVTDCRAYVITDTNTEADWRTYTGSEWIRSYVGAPLVAHGEVLGVINVDSATPGFFTPLQATRLEAFAEQAAVALINARLYLASQQSARELSKLYTASAKLLAAGNDLPTLAQCVVTIIVEQFEFTYSSLLLIDNTGTELQVVAQAGQTYPHQVTRLPLSGLGLTVMAVHTGQPLYVPDVTQDTRYVVSDTSTRTEFDIPLRVSEAHAPGVRQFGGHPGGRILGVINVEDEAYNAFSLSDQRILLAFAESATLALENALLLGRLQQARQVVEETYQLKNEFLSNTSHELRTPLTIILSGLGLVAEHAEALPAEDMEFVETALQAAHQLNGLVDNLLDIAQLTAGQLDVALEPVDVAPLLDEVCALLRSTADMKGLTLTLIPPPAAHTQVWADSEKLQQVLLHLIGNGLKFTEQGGVTVSTGYHPERHQLWVSIQDTGLGIAPERQTLLFEPFVTGDGGSTRGRGGMGLGLSIAQRLIELIGGTLSLYSAGEGHGSTFTIALPLLEATYGAKQDEALPDRVHA